MRVLSLHNFAKYGCFISINDKIIKNLLRWDRFQTNFWRPLAAKLWTGPKKVWDLMAPSTSVREDEMWCFSLFFENNARRPSTALVRSWVTSKRYRLIASAFLGRFRWYLQLFSDEKPFAAYWTVFKIFARGRYDWCPNGRKKLKIWENGCKVCADYFDHLEARWKKISTPYIVDVHSYKNSYFATALQGATIKLSTCSGSAKSAR